MLIRDTSTTKVNTAYCDEEPIEQPQGSQSARGNKDAAPAQSSACSKKASHNTVSTDQRTNYDSSVNRNAGPSGTVFSFNSPHTPSFPMKSVEAVRYYGRQLTEFEKNEILEYSEVYFIGLASCKKIKGSAHVEHNFGYDDDQGDYKYSEGDHISYRYEVVKYLGKGSFGTALQCVDHKTGK